jgi:NAD(P)-dependent dehydrogenase (short-subunit alcohol dehydrogenase family)
VCDVTDERQVREAVAFSTSFTGALDVVVNAAGIVRIDDIHEIWDLTFEVNLKGAMRVCREAIPVIGKSALRSIVNVSSVAAFNASPGMASYAASKAGLVALTRSIAHRYGAQGIRANCVCPGWVRTPMSESEMLLNATSNGTTIEEEFTVVTKKISLGRVGTPEEIAACALFLASDEASFVSGAILIADGGGPVCCIAVCITPAVSRKHRCPWMERAPVLQGWPVDPRVAARSPRVVRAALRRKRESLANRSIFCKTPT